MQLQLWAWVSVVQQKDLEGCASRLKDIFFRGCEEGNKGEKVTPLAAAQSTKIKILQCAILEICFCNPIIQQQAETEGFFLQNVNSSDSREQSLFALGAITESEKNQCGQSWVENLAESGILGRKQRSWNRIAFESKDVVFYMHLLPWGIHLAHGVNLGREVVTWISWKYMLGVLWKALHSSWAKTVWFRPCDSKGHQGPLPRDVPWQSFKWLVWMQL